MLRRALLFILAMAPAALPAASLASDAKPKPPETAFSGKLRPDILGVSTDATAESARAAFETRFKGHADAKADIQQQKLGDSGTSFVAAVNFNLPAGPKQTGELLSGSFSSPASGNRAYFIARNLTFAADQQPAKADMIKEIMGKYGVPTIVGDQHLYYIYRSGSVISSGTKYKEATALEAIDKPLDPRAAVKLNGETVRGSCVAVIKRAQTKAKTLSAMFDEAKGANCDGVLSVQLIPGTPTERVGIAQFTLLDTKLVVSATAIDNEAIAADQNERKAMPKGSAPKL
ncbi:MULTISPECIES: hypothetical protein [Bradyrhizobium]|jgi:hypothetical protein|uniref:Uncharacterized protein n=2 Tax=Bradyrhizobium TaxID=374 RepID=A0ABY0P6H1_9BRAD|nr:MULTISPECIES: hypothetical protein [Bradyrhizobium]SDH45847.1 hypothetical protein SAMN05444163_0186 [Bradyrhizobium ottawaense]SEE30814.1 hypothetical protein SAMN05444171_6982 [Bradyrhizobium lablabi]SHM27141.1 hypothetical protein SAMN05444321_5789 [Bradyrhizobium lablabi]